MALSTFRLRFHDPHKPNYITRIVDSYRKVILERIEFDFAAFHYVPEQCIGAFPGDHLFSGKQAIGYDCERFVSMTTFPDDYLLYSQLSGYFQVLQGNTRKLNVIVPQTVIHSVVPASSVDKV